MNMPVQWKRNPKPDPSVVAFTNAISEAAEKGQVRCMCAVTVNPMLEVEFAFVGELDEVRKTLLIGGLTRLIRKISE